MCGGTGTSATVTGPEALWLARQYRQVAMLRRAGRLAFCASLITQRAAKIRIRMVFSAKIATEPTDDTTGVAVMQTSSPEQQTGQGSRSARRRLIRGAFGAPAALTLYSGSAMAAGSLAGCFNKQIVDNVNPVTTQDLTSDGYLRVRMRAKGTGTGYSAWVSGQDLLTAAFLAGKPGLSFLGADSWYSLEVGDGITNTSGYLLNQIYTNTAAIAGGEPAVLPGRSVALRFDANGKVVGVTSSAGGAAVTGSCWASFVKTI